jgi:hypothetical protein
MTTNITTVPISRDSHGYPHDLDAAVNPVSEL